MAKRFILAAAVLLTGTAAIAGGTDTVRSGELNWADMIPEIVAFAPAYGNEADAHGRYARIQPGATVPMHTHGEAYHAVLLSGRLVNLLDTSDNRVEIAPSDYWHMAGGRPHGHICLSAEPCLVYIHSEGPWSATLVETPPEAGAN